MTSWVQFPLIYNFDIRFYLRQLSNENGRTMTLRKFPKARSTIGVLRTLMPSGF